MKQQTSLIGKKVGNLTVISKDVDRRWICLCACGNRKSIRQDKLKPSGTKSCGCLRKQSRFIHGQTNTAAYSSWRGMKERCENPNHKSYKNYAERGIKVCERWQTFENFLADMGQPTQGQSLERINNNDGYCLSNCKWADNIEQANNRRNNRILSFQGKSQTASQWARETGIPLDTILDRLNRYGWSIQKALTTPKRIIRGK